MKKTLILAAVLCAGEMTAQFARGQTNLIVNGTTNINSGTNSFSNTIVGQTTAGNQLNVSGSSTVLTNSSQLIVGNLGSSNSMVISGGADVFAAEGYVGNIFRFDGNAIGNTVLVTDSGSTLSNAGIFNVGFEGTGNQLTVSNQARFVTEDLIVGNGSTFAVSSLVASNAVLVTSNASMTVNDDLTIGFNGRYNSMTIADGGRLTSSNAYIGVQSEAFGNTVLVIGTGATWTNTGELVVSVSANNEVDSREPNNSLTVANGGTLTAPSGIVIGASNGAVGVLNIGRFGTNDSSGTITAPTISSGAGSGTVNFNQTNTLAITYVISGNIAVNQLGSGHTIVTNNNTYTGRTWVEGGRLTIDGGSISNTVRVLMGDRASGAEMILTNGGRVFVVSDGFDPGGFVVGDDGSSNSLEIHSGSFVDSVGDVRIGSDSPSSNNRVLISGSGAYWTHNGDEFRVGNSGDSNSLEIRDGGSLVTVGETRIGSGSGSISNTVLVDGVGSTWTNIGDLRVGNSGDGNRLVVTNGGAVNASFIAVGMNSSANDNVVIVESNSTITTTGLFDVGHFGSSNSLIITNGGKVFIATTNPAGGSSIGSFAAFGNSVLVTGPGSTLSNAGNFNVGFQGSSNRLTLSNQGQFITDSLTVGNEDLGGSLRGSSNAVVVHDATLTVNTNLIVGGQGDFNTMIITNGGKVFIGTDASAGSSSIGSFSAFSNSILVTGSGSTLSNAGNFNVGFRGSGNLLTLTNQGQFITDNLIVGNEDGGGSERGRDNAVVVHDATLTVKTNLIVGGQGDFNTMTISGGGTVTSSNGYLGLASDSRGNSVVVLGTGSIWSNSGAVIVGVEGDNSRLTVANGGKVTASSLVIAASNGSFGSLNFGRLGENDTEGTIDAPTITFGEGEGEINFNQSNTLTPTFVISGNASVNQLGIGHTIFTNNNVYNGWTIVDGGRLTIDGGSISNTAEVIVGDFASGVSMVITNNGAVHVDGDVLISAWSAGASNNVLDISSGQLTATNGTLNVGREGQGTLNVSGGTVSVANLVATNGAKSVINFTGGTIISRGTAISNNSDFFIGGTNGSGAEFVAQGGTHSFNSLRVGDNGSSNRLEIIDGASVVSGGGFIGYSNSSSNNSVVVTGGSVWSNSSSLNLGFYGSGNRLEISNGGTVAVQTNGSIGSIGRFSNSFNNIMLVTGNGSTFSADYLAAGQRGSSNSMVISEGGKVFTRNSSIGEDVSAFNNSVLITGEGSTWSNSRELIVGEYGENSSLVISNGASLFAGTNTFSIGYTNNSSNNSVLVTGSNSAITNLGGLFVGRDGSSNSLVISGGATMTNRTGEIGSSVGSSNNRVEITGSGSAMNTSQDFYVGNRGSSNSLVISNGGAMVNQALYIGVGTNASNNSVLVTAGSRVTNTAETEVGRNGSGNKLEISAGSEVFNRDTGAIGVRTSSSNNSVLVTDSGSIWSIGSNLTVGNLGSSNRLEIRAGGTVAVLASSSIGHNSASFNNSLLVTGSNSALTTVDVFYVGNSGTNNSLVISDGGTVRNGQGVVGQNSSSFGNNVLVTGAGSTWTSTNGLLVGRGGDSNSLIISNGGRVFVSGTNSVIGRFLGSTDNSVLVTGAGSTLSNSGALIVGQEGTGNSLMISSGGSVSASNVVVVTNNLITGNGTLTTTAGTTIDGGTFSPTGTNVLAVNGNLTFTNGGIYLWNLFANSTNSPSSGTNYTIPVALNGDLAVSTDSVLALNFADSVSIGNSFWNTNRQWRLIGGTSALSSGTNFSLAWATPDPSPGFDLSLFGLSASNNSLYLNYFTPVVIDIDVAPGTTNSLPSFNGPPTELVINGPTNGLAVLAPNNPKLISIVLSNGSLLSTNQNSIPTNTSVTVFDGAMGFSGSGTNTIGSLFVGGGQVGASNTIVNVRRFEQTGGALTGGTNATYWADNYFFAATNPASVGVRLDNLGTVLDFRSTAIVTTNANGAPVAPVVFENNMTYGGGTLITGGILQLGSSNSTGPVSILGVITNNGALNYGFNGDSTTMTNEVTGNGIIGQVGTGVLTVGNEGVGSSFTGSFAASRGTLAITTNSALGGSTNFFLADNGTLLAEEGITNITRNITVTNGVGIVDNNSGATLALAGTLTKNGTVLVLAGGSIDVSGQITGGTPGTFNSDLVIFNSITTLNNGNNNYVGPTFIVAGATLINGIADAMPTDTILNIGAESDSAVTNTYDMAGFDQSLVGLASATNLPSVNIVTNSGSAATLTIDDRVMPTSTVYAGRIAGDIALVRAGTGAITLTENNTYTGGTTINSGKIVTTANTALGTGPVSLLGGTLEVRSLLNIGDLTWTSGQIALPTLTSVNGIYVISTNGLALTGTGNFNLTGASLTKRVSTPLLGSTNMSEANFSTNNFAVTGLRGSYMLSISNNTLWIDWFGITNYAQYALTPNQANVARALNAFIDATGDRGTVNAALDGLADSQYPAAFEQVMPTPYASLPTMAFNTANALNSGMFQRMWVTRINGRGFSVGGMNLAPMQAEMGGTDDMGAFAINPSKDTKWGTFVDGNGIFANGGDVNYLQNYRSQSGGVTVGASYKWNENLATGVYAGYQGLQAEYNNGRITDNAVRFGVFGTYDVEDFYLNALVGGAYHGYTVNRNINFGGLDRTATGRPGAGEFNLALNGGYDFHAGDFSFGPFTGMQYTYVGVQGFTETGAGSLNLDVDPYNTSSLLYTLGAQAAYNWKLSKDVIVTPTIFAGWQHEFLQDAYQINSSFTTGGPASPFGFTTGTPARDNFYGGVGATVGLGDRWQFTATYSAFVGGQNQNSQNLYLGMGYEF